MPVKPAPVTCFLLRFEKSTVFVPVGPTTTLSTLRSSLLATLVQSVPPAESGLAPEPATLPSSASDIALWKGKPGERDGETEWTRLVDEKSGCDKWGLKEAEEIGVSFKNGGIFPEPNVIRPVDDEGE